MAESPILVTGATGQQGGAVAKALLQQGHPVRAMSRSEKRLAPLKEMGAEVVVADLENPKQLKEALSGVERAFLVTSWREKGIASEVQQGTRFIDAAKEAGLKYLVYTSVGAATANTGVPFFESKWQVEQYLQASGIPHSILRPVFFMENFSAPYFLPSLEKGTLSVPIGPNVALQMISLDVIGAFGAAALTERERFEGQALELASDELTFPEAMDKLSAAIGRPIAYKEMSEEVAEDVYGHDVLLMFQWFRQHGFFANFEALKKWGLPLTSFDQHMQTAGWVEQLKKMAVAK